MKLSKKCMFVILGCVAVCESVSFGEFIPPGPSDLTKILADPYTAFIENVVWPPDQVIRDKKIPLKKLKGELLNFRKTLQMTLKPELLPSDKVITTRTIAVKELRDNHDYLLLRYEYHGNKLQIEDGKSLFVLISPARKAEPKEADIAKYVRSVFSSTLSLPASRPQVEDPQVFVSTLDLGKSKCGNVTYLSHSLPPKFWYSYIKWWSDGDSVLFLISKALQSGLDLSERASYPEHLNRPRRLKTDEP